MPSDFYIFYKVCIEHNTRGEIDVKDHILENTREGYYWWDFERGENEELNDYYDRLQSLKHHQVERELEDFPTKRIYKNGEWLVGDTTKEIYMNIAKKYNISWKNIISVWKQGDYSFP